MEAVHEPPPRLAVNTLGQKWITRGLQGIEVAAKRPEVLRELVGQGTGKLLEGRAPGPFQPPQQMPLARDLNVPGHRTPAAPDRMRFEGRGT